MLTYLIPLSKEQADFFKRNYELGEILSERGDCCLFPDITEEVLGNYGIRLGDYDGNGMSFLDDIQTAIIAYSEGDSVIRKVKEELSRLIYESEIREYFELAANLRDILNAIGDAYKNIELMGA